MHLVNTIVKLLNRLTLNMLPYCYRIRLIRSKALSIKLIAILGLLSAQCMTNVEEITGEQVQNVSFQAEVLPILKQYCVSCHGNTAGINLDSYQAVMNNEGFNWKSNVVNPGDATNSGLYDVLLEQPRFQLQQMPTGGPYLTGDEIEIIKTWINEGAQNN